MAIEFENVSHTHVIDPLVDLILAEFRGHTTFRAFGDTPKSSSWIEIQDLTESLLEDLAGASVRRYAVEFAYVQRVGKTSGVTSLKERSNTVERLVALLRQNKDYSPAGVYHWHNGEVGDVDHNAETDEDNDNGFARTAIKWACDVTQIIS